ncbi:hypothetical protein [Pseudomonas shirazica]|uniref:hypothetical protein n=1 Tax=Pseudomonas shirazica TaxID=1940636 RepID=UPI001EDED357|nr:hypothetical protein [Pseudomonas shirazica]
MPTENRSNDAAGWIACDDGLHLIQMDKNLSHYGWVFRKVDGGLPYSVREATPHEMAHAQARQHLRIGVAQIAGQAQAPQPHPEPIAWMVGTAFWWTKEEAERDAAATGLPIVGLGPMADTGSIDQLSQIIRDLNDERDEIGAEAGRLRTQVAERDALLRDKSGDLIRMAAHLISAPLFALQDLQDEDKKMTRARVDHAVDVADARLKDAAYELRRIADALSASAGPIQRDHEIPGSSFQRLNMLANQGE